MKSTKTMIITAMFAAVIAVLAQIAFPLPSGVPVTLQTFAVALTGVVLGAKLGTISTFVYILLGAVGVPVFSGFNGGLGAIVGKTGGFIWGFLFLAFFAGAGAAMMKGAPDSGKKDAGKGKTALLSTAAGFVLGIIGLLICHVLGTAQFAILGNMGFWQAAVLVSVPYLVKDVCSLALACILGLQVRKQLYRASFLQRPVRGKNLR